MTQLFIGIDPGMTGAMAAIDARTGQLIVKRFDGGMDQCEVLDSLPSGRPLGVAIELVHAMPGQGVVSMFTFGKGYGELLGWLKASRIDFSLVSPRSWQRILPASDGPKNGVKAFCSEKWGLDTFVYKGCRVPHQGSMDAACIAYYHQKVLEGTIEPAKPKAKVHRLRPLRLVD